MKILRVAVAVCAFLAALTLLNRPAFADQVDDLLAGKPVLITEDSAADEVGTEEQADEANLGDRVFKSEEESLHSESDRTLSNKSWLVALEEPSHAGLDAEQPSAPKHHPAGRTMALSVVPEPSAVALAALSLVYFLIFFRRRYAF